MSPMPLTLAFDPDVIIYAVFAVIAIGSWIINALRKNSEQTPPPRTHDADEDPTREERVTRRPGPAAEPGNLTMADRIARARAKAQYEQRTGQPVPPPSHAPTARPMPAAPPVSPTESWQTAPASMNTRDVYEARRRDAEQRRNARRVAQQQAEAEQRRRQEEARRRSIAAAEQARRQAASAERARREAAAEEETPFSEVTRPTGTSAVHRPAPGSRRGIGRSIGVLNRQELRRAVLLKEILDPPLALRPANGPTS